MSRGTRHVSGKVTLELELVIAGYYAPGRAATREDPPEDPEVAIEHLAQVFVEGQLLLAEAFDPKSKIRDLLLAALLAHPKIQDQMEDVLIEEASK